MFENNVDHRLNLKCECIADLHITVVKKYWIKDLVNDLTCSNS